MIPPPDGDAADWTSFELRPGTLFLVGDPKQAIYRFRGADIAAYVRAREAFRALVQDGVLSISTNFRSCPEIMRFVNRRFEMPLSAENGQPGFRALDPFRAERGAGLSVAVLDVAVADDEGKATALQRRDGEAEAVAETCARLIGSEPIDDPKTGGLRPCRAGDIALLAPTGNDLWRYEEALERRGIPVATQAGKGLFRRQEIQDLLALTRVFADRRDTLALGALLRGPLVGLTEEELLDIVWQLPHLWRQAGGSRKARSRRSGGPYPASAGAGHRGQAANATAPCERHHAARTPVTGCRRAARASHFTSAPWRPGGAGPGECRSISRLQPRLRCARAARLRRSDDGGLGRRGPRGRGQA